MNDDFNYLSDEELNSLIESTEKSGLLEAPISFEAEVLKRLEKAEAENIVTPIRKSTVSFEDKKREYSKFRFQVCMAMAAAILFLVISPFLSAGERLGSVMNQMEPEESDARQTTSYVSQFLGNHILSESIGSNHIGKED